MIARIAFPFLTLDQSAVKAGPWTVRRNDGDEKPVEEYLSDWDYNTSIELSRDFEVCFDIAANQLQIAEERLKLTLVARLGTGIGRFPRSIVETSRHPFETGGSLRVNFRPEPSKLSGVVDLSTFVLLGNDESGLSPLSPSRMGHRLWSDKAIVRLEGEEPRFPIEIASFSRIFGNAPEARAPWHLNWTPGEWDRDFQGGVRLYVNEDLSEFVAAVKSHDPFTLRVIMADVVGQIVERFVLDHADEDKAPSFETGSIGSVAVSWATLAWPGTPFSLVRSTLETKPGRFRSAMLSVAEVGGLAP